MLSEIILLLNNVLISRVAVMKGGILGDSSGGHSQSKNVEINTFLKIIQRLGD